MKHRHSPLAQGPASSGDEGGDRWTELVEVASFLEVHVAYAARAALCAAGLHAVVRDEHVAGMRWDYALALGGVRLCVPPDEVEAARALLEGFDPDEVARAAEASESVSRRCPVCGSHDLAPVVRGRLPTLLTLLLLGLPALFVRKRIACLGCGAEYTD